jgi:hypothetical protein
MMANLARNASGQGKAYAFNVITPMRPWATWIVKGLLFVFDLIKPTQQTAKNLSFLPFVHWVVVERNRFPNFGQPRERLAYDYLFFCSTFNGSWESYIDAFADVLTGALNAVWRWSVGYPGASPVGALKAYIRHNQIETDHHYCAYPGASVCDVRSALNVRRELEHFAVATTGLNAEQFAHEYDRLILRLQNDLGSFGTLA